MKSLPIFMENTLRPDPPFQPRNPHFEALVRRKLAGQHFMRAVGIELDEISPGYVTAVLPMEKRHLQQDGNAHGGVIMTLLDVAMGFAAFTLVEPNQHVVSGQMDIHFMRPGRGQGLWAEGAVEKAGKRLSFCHGRVWALTAGKPPVLAAAARSVMVTFVPQHKHNI